MKELRDKLKKIAIEKEGAKQLSSGALVLETGEFTGRSPNAKRIVLDNSTKDTVDWENSVSISGEDWAEFKESFLDYANKLTLFENCVYAGHTNFFGISIRVKTELAWHSLFAMNMFSKIEDCEADFDLYYIPSFSIDPHVIISFEEKIILISGTRYAGELKKSIFTVLNHLLPDCGVFPMHCSINLDSNLENPTVFFGLSGTGKTTLSADPNRRLIGDDEHGWSSNGIFNFESGCYAKVVNVSQESEPEIWKASQMEDSILENVILKDGVPDFFDNSLTDNTRSSYPLRYIDNSISNRSSNLQPKDVVLLTCDAFSILPAIAKLSPEEAWKFFMIGYTSKVAGTERGIDTPIATFSPCFGSPFMTRKPSVYAEMLKNYLEESGANCWMLNTGWTHGPVGIGERISLEDTRDILNKIYSGELAKLKTFEHTYTGLNVPQVIDVDLTLLKPEFGWVNTSKYEENCTFLLNEMVKILQD